MSLPSPTRVSVIDLGTFSAILLIAEVRHGHLIPICEERQTIDLAYDRGRAISLKAIARAVKIVRRFDRMVRESNSEKGLMVATAALRHASNRFAVVRELRTITPLLIRVLTDRQEAQFAARGALLGLPRIPHDALVVDIGGGSSEFIQPDTNAFRGLTIGAAWATSKWKDGCPRDRDKRDLYFLSCAEKVILDLDTRSFTNRQRVVGLGGTITTLAAIQKGMKKFDVEGVHGSTLTSDWITATAAQLSRMPDKSIRALVPFDPSSARVLTAGTYLWSRVLNRLDADRVTVSARGLRWGVAAHLAGLP